MLVVLQSCFSEAKNEITLFKKQFELAKNESDKDLRNKLFKDAVSAFVVAAANAAGGAVIQVFRALVIAS